MKGNEGSRMRKTRRFMVVVLAAALLGGCEGTREMLGLGKTAPDEFAVYSRAPLSLPPDYGLRPPAPGKARPQSEDTKVTARDAMLGGRATGDAKSTPPAQGSPGLQALLKQTGGLDADSSIRTVINRESTILAEEDEHFSDRLMFWTSQTEYGSIVDPAKENRRIQENQALGRPITEGDVPTIERRRKAILEGLFD